MNTNLLTQVCAGSLLSPQNVTYLKEQLIPLFKSEPNLLYMDAPINVVGDIHADFNSLVAVVNKCGKFSSQRYLFLGDYVDRGNNSHGVVQLLLCAKLCYPEHIFLLRGNHECRQVAKLYGFYEETVIKYPENSETVFEDFNQIFDTLPLAALIGNKIFAVHAGLSPTLVNLDGINELDRFQEVPKEGGLMTDLLWSDPNSEDINGFSESPRGVGFLWGIDVSESFCQRNNVNFIIRSHQLVMEGCFWSHNNRVITIFTSANYCKSCGNKGGYLKIEKDLSCELYYLDPEIVHSKLETTIPQELVF